MFNKRYALMLSLLVILSLFTISCASAVDLNETNNDSSQIGEISDIEEELTSSNNVIYFDASATSDGDGSQSNPYKYLNSNTLNNYISSENTLTAHFASGTYDLNTDFKIKSPNVVFIGEGSSDTIFNSALSDKYDFEIMQNSYFELNNLTLNHVNIQNHGTLNANNVKFKDNAAFNGKNAPSTYNFNSSYGGAIICDSIGNSRTYLYLNNCIFLNSTAYTGGAISLKNSNLVVSNSRFTNSKSNRLGGAIYALNSNINITDSIFNVSNSTYGGVINAESSSINLKNTNMTNSNAYSFGGAIASKYSNINVTRCSFSNYSSATDGGGAIYNFKGNVNITDSSFIGGLCEFGGAIANLQSNLTILSSRFINNTGDQFGGVIFNMYGYVYINGSYFKNSHSFEGGAIYSKITDALIFTNNIFLNCTSKSDEVIFIDMSRDRIVESGNHFENVYYAYVDYDGYLDDEKFRIKSKVLTYIISNTGKFLNSYDIDSNVEYSDFISLDIFDTDYPDNTTIFINSSEKPYFTNEYTIKRQIMFCYDTEYGNYYLLNGAGNVLTQKDIFIEYSLEFWGRNSFETNRAISISTNTYNTGTGMYPTPTIYTHYSDSANIPSYYDSRDYGYVTPVKDQAEGGNCWAFAGLATLEACIKKATNITYDFSEENAKNLMASFSTLGLDLDPNNGGYDSMLMGYLTSWLGPVPEETEAYDDFSSLSGVYFSEYNIQNIKFLPPRQNNLDNDAYKRAIMDYGAVSIIFNWADSGFHAVSLVGWDDNYNDYDSLGTYTKGAWIFKNSWGPEWEDNGFGHLSYNTPLASDQHAYCHAYTFVFNKDDDYIGGYQYDYSGVSDYICYDGPVYYANKFTTKGDSNELEFIAGFSTYFKYPTNYTVTLYKNDEFVLTQSGFSDAGYYTIPFNKFTDIHGGEEFTIIIENHNDGWNYVPVCKADELTIENFKTGVSFISYDGNTWNDLHNLRYPEYLYSATGSRTCQVACIKAFTNWRKVLYYSTYIDVSDFSSIDMNEKVSINVTIEGGSYNFNTTERIEGSLVNMNINGKDYYAVVHNGKASLTVSFDKAGQYTLQAQYKNNLFKSDIVGFHFTVNKKDTSISASSVSKVYGGSEKSLVTLKDADGRLITNTLITFTVNGKTGKIRTNAKGQASIPVSLSPKTYTATIKFAGDGNYNGASTTVKFIVKKATPKMIASKKTFKLKVKTKKYDITLKDNNGKAIKKAKVTIKINGKTYKATTNAKGKATFKITKLTKKGTFKATVKFASNSYYNAISKNVKITVK